MNSTSRAANIGGYDTLTTMMPEARKDFVQTDSVKSLSRRALAYINSGYSVHFRGPAGTGKTTMAMHTAALLGRPVVMITGDEEMVTSHLVGAESGYNYRKVTDNYIHTVSKVEESSGRSWNDHRLTTACREGYTLIYDEFTRSRAEANNVLLSVLEEGILVLPAQNRGEPFIKVHPDFRVIFTSNPQEYAGVHDAQDALSDRIVTIDIGAADRGLEVSIASARSGLELAKTALIVDMVRAFRDTGEYDQTPTLRSCIIICRMVANEKLDPTIDDPYFVQICLDILGSKSTFGGKEHGKRSEQEKLILDNLRHHCPSKTSMKPSVKNNDTKSKTIKTTPKGRP